VALGIEPDKELLREKEPEPGATPPAQMDQPRRATLILSALLVLLPLAALLYALLTRTR